jgi:hypothetical protein
MACSTNHVAARCNAGSCGGTCATGFANCNLNFRNDGCEVDLARDGAHCGACGAACPSATETHATGACAASRCACVEGWADCDGSRANGCEARGPCP